MIRVMQLVTTREFYESKEEVIAGVRRNEQRITGQQFRPTIYSSASVNGSFTQKTYNGLEITDQYYMHDLTGFQRDLLYVISGLDEPHGLAIKDELDDYYDTEIHHGRLYPNLDTLVEKGLVEKGQQDRRTNYYAVTQRGQRELDARDEWEAQYVTA